MGGEDAPSRAAMLAPAPAARPRRPARQATRACQVSEMIRAIVLWASRHLPHGALRQATRACQVSEVTGCVCWGLSGVSSATNIMNAATAQSLFFKTLRKKEELMEYVGREQTAGVIDRLSESSKCNHQNSEGELTQLQLIKAKLVKAITKKAVIILKGHDSEGHHYFLRGRTRSRQAARARTLPLPGDRKEKAVSEPRRRQRHTRQRQRLSCGGGGSARQRRCLSCRGGGNARQGGV